MGASSTMISSKYFPAFQTETFLGQNGTKKHVAAALFGVLLLVLAPYIHFGVAYSSWNEGKLPVDRDKCKCSCWDTLFKGSYEKRVPGYKHMYFNITSNTLKMWAFTMLVAIVTYEVLKHLVTLFLESRLRISMFVLFGSVFYSHYYTWWSYINVWNDDFYEQWYHQAFFSLTELLSTTVVVYLCNRENTTRPRLLLVIINMALLHILASGADQFVNNVFRSKGAWHQYMRDLGLMIPDVLHLIVSFGELWNISRANGVRFAQTLKMSDVLVSVISVVSLWFICSIL